MSIVDDLVLRVRRGDTAATRALKDVYFWAQRWNVPETESLRQLYGSLYRVHDMAVGASEMLRAKLIYEPMLRSKCHSVGTGLSCTSLPYIRGKVKITLGDNCSFGYFSVRTGRFYDEPELIIGNSSGFSYGVALVVNKRIRIGNHVRVAGRCWLADTDGHPGAPDRRANDEDIDKEDVKDLVIEDNVWIGHGCHILKGVTIGEGAVIAAGSTVASDVPPGALAMGVPARMVKRPW